MREMREMRDEELKDFTAFLKEFREETDRGAGLVGAAIIDHRLTDALRAVMVDKGREPLARWS